METVLVAVFPTNVKQDECSGFLEVLSNEERARAAQHRFEADRMRYIVTRATGRRLVAHFAKTDPEKVVFETTPFGKPFVSSPPEAAKFFFNMSHSGDLAVIAMTTVAEVGIDLEQMSPIPEITELAGRFFSEGEYSWLVSLPKSEQLKGFYRIWTLKEATLKALGTGLATQLNQVTVDLSNGSPVLTVLAAPGQKRWSAVELNVQEGYAAALAMEADRMPNLEIATPHTHLCFGVI